MTELRDKVALEISRHEGAQTVWDVHLVVADRILALPEIAEALRARAESSPSYGLLRYRRLKAGAPDA